MNLDKDPEIEALKKTILLNVCSFKEDLRNWIYLFFDLLIPDGYIDEESNSSPMDAIWDCYNAVRLNTGDETPGYILLSARSCFKTLSVSILEVILLLHFRITIAHAAAIENQSNKSVQYCSGFIRKIKDYLTDIGWRSQNDNKRSIAWTDTEGELAYIKIVILTKAGANCDHTTMLCIDEVDLCNSEALIEAKLIPDAMNGIYPIKIFLSTRKYAFGLMQQEIDNAESQRHQILRWNLLDVTEHCPTSRCLSDKPKILRYAANSLPLSNISEDQHAELNAQEQMQYFPIECFEGCASCPLLQVCKTKLHTHRPYEKNPLLKPIISTINTIASVPPSKAEAQLLCWKPSTEGLIYSKFTNKGNTISIEDAYKKISMMPAHNVQFELLINFIKTLGVKIEAGLDWGFTNNFAIIVGARWPNGMTMILDTYAAPGLELDDCVAVAQGLKEKYGITKFWADPAYPSYIKTFNSRHLPCGTFTKDVALGIESVRLAICDAAGNRNFFIVKTANNQQLITAHGTYHWKIGANGKPTDSPDHTEESDIMDALRYYMQNQKKIDHSLSKNKDVKQETIIKPENQLRDKILELATGDMDLSTEITKKNLTWV